MTEYQQVLKLYYQEDGITIYHGDCKDILPHLPKVDLVLTDPPYGIGESMGKNDSRGKLTKVTNFEYSEWDKKTIDFRLIQLIIGKASNSIIFGGNYYPMEPSSCWLVWDKENGNNDFADCELAWTNLKKAVRLFKFRWAGMLQGNMKEKEQRYHPTQKPTEVMRWCIQKAGDDVKTILDPFMGSGTTLRAAKDLGRQAIGIEIEEKYCEIAVKRLRQEVFSF